MQSLSRYYLFKKISNSSMSETLIHSIRRLSDNIEISEKIVVVPGWYQVWKQCFEEGMRDIEFDYADYRGGDADFRIWNDKRECETKWNTILSILYEKQKQNNESLLKKKKESLSLLEPKTESKVEKSENVWIVILNHGTEKRMITVSASSKPEAEYLMIKHIASLNFKEDLSSTYIKQILLTIQPLNTSNNFVSMF